MLPAYAGMIPALDRSVRIGRCAPRVCGDDPTLRHPWVEAARVLPAYAGMILDSRIAASVDYRAPRVCGDDPPLRDICTDFLRCSPRMRG